MKLDVPPDQQREINRMLEDMGIADESTIKAARFYANELRSLETPGGDRASTLIELLVLHALVATGQLTEPELDAHTDLMSKEIKERDPEAWEKFQRETEEETEG